MIFLGKEMILVILSETRTNLEFLLLNIVHNGTESISYLGSKIWGIVPDEIKEKSSLSNFKESIKKMGTYNCRCEL